MFLSQFLGASSGFNAADILKESPKKEKKETESSKSSDG